MAAEWRLSGLITLDLPQPVYYVSPSIGVRSSAKATRGLPWFAQVTEFFIIFIIRTAAHQYGPQVTEFFISSSVYSNTSIQ
eukprot:COSAG01_NODE_2742_length_7152_cov_9.268538_7_plen_81_part_00